MKSSAMSWNSILIMVQPVSNVHDRLFSEGLAAASFIL
jgi:hypothetical protein